MAEDSSILKIGERINKISRWIPILLIFLFFASWLALLLLKKVIPGLFTGDSGVLAGIPDLVQILLIGVVFVVILALIPPLRNFVGVLFNEISRLTPLVILCIFLFVSIFPPSWQNESGNNPTVAEATNDETRVQLQLKLSDLSSGVNLLRGKTIDSLKNTYFGLTIVYQAEDAESATTEKYHNVKVINAIHSDGTVLPRISPATDSLVLTLSLADFEKFIKQRPDKKDLYLVEQVPAETAISSPADNPPSTTNVNPFPTPVGEVIFDIAIDETFKSDVNQFQTCNKVDIILSTQFIDPATNMPKRQSFSYSATVINILDENYRVIPTSPYMNARMMRISIEPGTSKQNALSFASDLSAPLAIFVIMTHPIEIVSENKCKRSSP